MKKLQFTKEELEIVLGDERFTPEKLVNFLSVDFGKIYNADAGVWEGYTIREHTIMMMGQFEKYFVNKQLPAKIDYRLFRFVLALHDIGKPQAILAGDKNMQHIYTVAMIKNIFEILEFSESDKNMAVALIKSDMLGRYIKGNKSAKLISSSIIQLANYAGLNGKDFFELLAIFYRCDAGSYTVDAGGFESLDHLFIFDREKPELAFASDILVKVQKLQEIILAQ